MKKQSKSKRNNDSKQSNNKIVFFKTQALIVIINLIVLMLISVIAYCSSINRCWYFYIAISAFSITSFIGGYYSGYKIHENGMVTGLLFCLPLNIIISLISLTVNSFKADITFFISLAILLICSMLGGILSVNTRMKAKKNRKGR